MMRRWATKAVGTAVVLAHLPSQRRAASLSSGAIDAARDARLRRLVRFAAGTVPYYQAMFRTQGIDPRDIRTAADLDRLPLLDKAAVRRDPELFRSRSRRGLAATPFVTSGSTGSPVTIYHDPVSLVANIAYAEPEKQVIRDFLGRGAAFRQMSILYSGSTVRKIWGVYRGTTFLPPPAGQRVIRVEEPVETIVAAINEFRPDMLTGYGSYLEVLFKLAARRGMALHRPRLLVYGGDAMTEDGRRLLEREFGIAVFSRYNAVEALRIGFNCEQRHGFHLRQDLCYLRLAGPSAAAARPGEPGEVVISNLVNRGTVLLNYRLGDIGVMPGVPCACGRPFPLLTDLLGRIEDVLVLPGDRIVHPRAVWNVFKGRSDILRYQLVQREPDRFELKLMTPDRTAYGGALPAVLDGLRQLLGPSSRIEPIFCEDLPAPPGGKFRPVVSHCNTAASG